MSSLNFKNVYSPILEDSYVCESIEVVSNFIINYIQTITGAQNGILSAKSLVSQKKKQFEKIYNPVSCKITKFKENRTVKIAIRRINSPNENLLNVLNVDMDEKNSQYLYLEACDDSGHNRVHIFNVINENNLKEIQLTLPSFGTKENKAQLHYFVPTNMSELVCCIHTFYLPDLGKHVSIMKEQMSDQIMNVFNKLTRKPTVLTRISNSIKLKDSFIRPKQPNSFVKFQTRSISPRFGRKNTNLERSEFKSVSIENLLSLSHDLNKQNMSLSKLDQKYNSNNALSKCYSTHSSLNGNDIDSSTEELNFFKFENFLNDECGLKYFQIFVSREFSSENLKFWQEVNTFSKILDEEKMKKEAYRIFNTYMDPKSEDQTVNLENYIIEDARKKLTNPCRNMFDIASNHVYQTMKNDSYTRFLKSSLYDSWRNEIRSLKSTKSSYSLSPNKKKTFKMNIFKSGRKSSSEISRKSSILTTDSDVSGGNSNSPNVCEITMAYDNNKLHIVNIEPNKKLIYYLKKIDKKITDINFVALNLMNNEVVNFSENLSNVFHRQFIVDKSSLVRIGFVSNSLDSKLYEDFYFVVKSRNSMYLFDIVGLLSKYLPKYVGKLCLLQENNPKSVLNLCALIQDFHHSSLLIMELDLFGRAKFYGKPLRDSYETLWKRIMNDNSFQNNLPFDKNNVLDSRSDLFKKHKMNPRQVGFETINERLYRDNGNMFDDQRGLCTEDQLATPEFLKETYTNDPSKVQPEFSFSDNDTYSDVSPTQYELISDFD